jgi:GNAT superfamily N-acetyltransferase
MPLSIRPATQDDAELILRFITELAIYEKAEHEVKTDAQGIRDSLFASDSPAYALIAENNGEPVGFAVYFFNYSTWLGKRGLYLEDLYVRPDQRGEGFGKALLKHLARIAVERGCGRMEWSVLDWNTPAIDFYRSLNATPQDEWTTFRLTGSALLEAAS